MSTFWRSPSSLATFLVVAITVVVSVNGLWTGSDGNAWKETIRSDAKGYYSYLPAMFLRGDLGQEAYAFEYVHQTPNGTLNKYFCGTAICMAPWFAIGHGLALMDPDAPRDGYSAYEMKAISFGAWMYLMLGLLALRRLLLRMEISESIVMWIILGLGLATPLLQYTAIQPGWSHVYSFCLVSVFLLTIQVLAFGGNARWAIASAGLFGLIVLIRPVNGLVLLAIPIVAGSDTLMLVARVIKKWQIALLALVVAALVIGIQPRLWHLQTGNWFEWGYRNEGFYWDRPMIREVLFGFRRGLLLWTPIFILPALHAIWLWKYDRVRSAFSVIYWSLNTYVISCWWIWYYGSGFASRVYIEHYPVLVIPFALVLQRISRPWWTATRIWIACCIALFLFQYWQYRTGIIHHEHMDAEKYAYTLLKTDDRSRNSLGGSFEEPPFHPNGLQLVLSESTDLERPSRYWTSGVIDTREHAFSRDHVCVFDRRTEFGRSFKVPPGIIPPGKEVFLDVAFMRYEARAGDAANALCVTEVIHMDGSNAFYDSFRMEPVTGTQDSTWRPLSFQIPVPALEAGDRLTFFLWNKDKKGAFLIDDLMARLWVVK